MLQFDHVVFHTHNKNSAQHVFDEKIDSQTWLYSKVSNLCGSIFDSCIIGIISTHVMYHLQRLNKPQKEYVLSFFSRNNKDEDYEEIFLFFTACK